ncbi:uncharacterized protein [Watersipora subatra]|uniref:uncharacterized protein n=1 Tax=Watersipora subatra TaxID=2589382 RepID=UPI00355BF360
MPREGRFYVEYLGWKEARGLHGRKYVDPVLSKLLSRNKSTKKLRRMTIKVSREELQITQEVTSEKGKAQKIKYPAQQMCDVSYVSQYTSPNANVVGCIFLGYNSKTNCAAHVHGYVFDSSETAAIFVKLISTLIAQEEYRQRVLAMEHDLLELGHHKERSGQYESMHQDTMGSDGASHGSLSPNSSDNGFSRHYPTADEALKARQDIVIQRSASQRKTETASKLFENVQDELSHKLTLQQEKELPILLPPKDYDTIVRRYGHLSIRGKVKQRSVIAADSIFPKEVAQKTDQQTDAKQRRENFSLQHSQSYGSGDQDGGDSASSHSSTDEDPSVFGLYRGLRHQDGSTTAQEDMAMWSPEYSFGSQPSSDSTKLNSSRAGLRRMKVVTSK